MCVCNENNWYAKEREEWSGFPETKVKCAVLLLKKETNSSENLKNFHIS